MGMSTGMSIDRRLLLKLGTLGLGALHLPGAAQMLSARGFTHGVASGEPAAQSVLLWTRYVGSGETRLRAEIAADPRFRRVIAGDEVTAHPDRDYCAKLVIDGLSPGRWYHYRFIAPDGSVSDVGRTRTLPDGDVARFGIGLFSCANMGFGFFNAYGHAAARDDIDLMVHAGDYLYEYGVGTYPETPVAGRNIEPTHEMVTLADYRLRYASYRMDPDLRRLHQRFPMVAQWDDHEFANDTWMDGAQNHQLDSEGEWSVRKAVARRVYHEWMPVGDADYNSYAIGALATLFRAETRVTGRAKPLDLGAALRGQSDIARAIASFRDGPWSDPSRTLMGPAQEAWLYDSFGQSVRGGTRWQILSQQVVMGTLKFPDDADQWIPSDAPAYVRQRAIVGAAAARAGLPFNFDAWDGYPAARDRLLGAAQASNSNLVVLSGDSHNAWGNNLPHDGRAAGVEFASHSVTSPGFENYVRSVAPVDAARGLRQANANLAFVDTSRRGYVSLDIRPDAVRGTWHFLPGVTTRGITGVTDHSLTVRHGERRFAAT